MVVGLQHLLICYAIYSTQIDLKHLPTLKAIHLLSVLSYRKDKKTCNGWLECTILTPVSVKKWHNRSLAFESSFSMIS